MADDAVPASTRPGLKEDALRVLLRRIAARDERALAELDRLVGKRIFAFVLNRLRDPDLTAEVVNNVLFEVWKQPERFNGGCQFMTWVLGIARFKTMHAFRDRPPEYDELDEEQPDDAPGAFETLAGKQLRAAMLAAMDRLTPDHREALHLLYFEDLSIAEIAEIQRCPVGTVKTRLHHARLRLREFIDPSGMPQRSHAADARNAFNAAPQV